MRQCVESDCRACLSGEGESEGEPNSGVFGRQATQFPHLASCTLSTDPSECANDDNNLLLLHVLFSHDRDRWKTRDGAAGGTEEKLTKSTKQNEHWSCPRTQWRAALTQTVVKESHRVNALASELAARSKTHGGQVRLGNDTSPSIHRQLGFRDLLVNHCGRIARVRNNALARHCRVRGNWTKRAGIAKNNRTFHKSMAMRERQKVSHPFCEHALLPKKALQGGRTRGKLTRRRNRPTCASSSPQRCDS